MMNTITTRASASSQSADVSIGCTYVSGDLTRRARALVGAKGLPFDALARAPYSVANFIIKNQQLTAGKDVLKIAVLGAHMQDVACAGAMYQLVPELIGWPLLQITVDLVGPYVCGDFANVNLTQIGLQPAMIHRMKTSQWWKSLSKDERPDLIFVFHPGMEKHHAEWMHSSELPKILSANIPVVFFSYDRDECERDAHIVEAYGGAIEKAPAATVNNPFFDMNGVADFGGAVFTARGFKKNPRAEVDAAIDVVKNLSFGLGEGYVQSGYLMSHRDVGQSVTVMRRGTPCEVMHLISDIYLDPNKEELFSAQNGVEKPCCKPMPAPGVAELVRSQPNDFDRALLAGEILGEIQMYRSMGLI